MDETTSLRMDVKSLKCNLCDKQFPYKANLSNHTNHVHGFDNDMIKCHICDGQYLQSNLESHIKAIHGHGEKFKCEVCEKYFSTRHVLFDHQNQIHRDNSETSQKVKCFECEKTFSYKKTLKVHMKTIHKKIKDYKCSICPLDFTSFQNLEKHRKSAHEEPIFKQCPLCPGTFIKVENHIKRVHERLEKKYVCDVCNKSFISISSLRTSSKPLVNTELRKLSIFN